MNTLNTNYSYQQQVSYSNVSGPNPSHANTAVLINSGLTDFEGAKNVARRIMDTYDRDRNGHIDSI